MEWPRRTNPSAAFTTGVFFLLLLLLLFSFFSFVKLAFVTFGSVLSRGWIKNGASCSRVLEPAHRCRLYTLADLFAQPLIVLLEFTIPCFSSFSHWRRPVVLRAPTFSPIFQFPAIPRCISGVSLLPFVWLIFIEIIWETSAIKYIGIVNYPASCRALFPFLFFSLLSSFLPTRRLKRARERVNRTSIPSSRTECINQPLSSMLGCIRSSNVSRTYNG